MPVEAKFSAPLQCLFVPKRFKVLYGGRGAAKSWGIARALLLLAVQRRVRVLCVRELQKSIEDSVHKLLSDQIGNLELQGFHIEKARIWHDNGSEFFFEGIKNNINAIKSFEGITHCWVEEANKVSRNSWEVLIPTIRTEGSEIWVSFNPELDTDYTYKRFVLDKSLKVIAPDRFSSELVTCPAFENERTFVIKMNWRDNPWFPTESYKDMLQDKENDYDHYLNIWEGQTVQHLEGAVYAKALRKMRAEDRFTIVPWEPSVPVNVYWDLGRADKTTMWFIQRVALQWRVLRYYENSGEELTHYLRVLQEQEYVYGTMVLPHDAKHKKLGYKHSIEERFVLAGYDTHVVPKGSVTDGIDKARSIFGQCWFDSRNANEGVNVLGKYRYKVNGDGSFSDVPLHVDSDGADGFRTFAMSSHIGSSPRAQERKAKQLLERLNPFSNRAQGEGLARPGQGWLR